MTTTTRLTQWGFTVYLDATAAGSTSAAAA
jgi:hypothetical protein